MILKYVIKYVTPLIKYIFTLNFGGKIQIINATRHLTPALLGYVPDYALPFKSKNE